jgi:predicted transporter
MMAKPTILISLILIGIGIYGYTQSEPKEDSGKKSPTALIPAFFGAPILLCGVLALDEKKRKHAMHAGATLGLLGFIGSASRLPSTLGKEEVNQLALFSQGSMALLCLIFVGLCVRSFVMARKEMKANGEGSS